MCFLESIKKRTWIISGLCFKDSEWRVTSCFKRLFFKQSIHVCPFVFDTNTIPVNRTTVLQITVSKEMDLCKVGGQSIVVTVDHRSLLLQFKTPSGPCSPFLGQFRVQSFTHQCHARRARWSLWLCRHEELPAVTEHMHQHGVEKRFRRKRCDEPELPASNSALLRPQCELLDDASMSGASQNSGSNENISCWCFCFHFHGYKLFCALSLF